LTRNFTKINNLLTENTTNQKEIKSKMLSLENKTKKIQNVLKKKKKLKAPKRSFSLKQQKKG